MALVKSGTFGGSPSAYYEIHADLLGGSGNTRQVKVHLALKVNGGSSSYYGYPLNWLPKIHTSNGGWQHVKGSERWNGSEGLRWYSWTATVDVGTTSSTSIGVGFDLKRSDGGSTNWNTSQSGSFNVGSTNVPPVISGTVATSPSGTIPENTGTIKVTSPAASDANNNLSGYKIQVSINGGGYSQIYKGSSREYNHNISGYGQGTTFKYAAEAYDSTNAYSSFVYSETVTKNTFTGDTLASSSSVDFSSTSLSFTYSGAKNTNGNTTFTRTLSCDGIAVYGTLPASPATVTIFKSGATPSGCYIKFDDIKNKFKGSNYTGTLSFTLTTTNAYGTSETSSKAISVDIRENPKPATGATISTTASESTIYKKVASANNYYFLPDGSGVARVKWSAGSDNLGESVTYEIFVAYGSGSWQKIADVPSGTLYYNHVVPRQSVSQSFKYLVRTKTSYGWYSDTTTSTQTLHYYNTPSITVGEVVRTETTATISVTVKTSSSIPNIGIVGTWSGQGSGSLTASQAAQNINVTGLTGSGTYTITVVYNDNTGFSGNQSRAIAIGANLPVMFLNKYGLGVGGAKADSANALVVGGRIQATKGGIVAYTELGANVNLNDIKTPGEYNQNANANTSTALNYPEAQAGHLTVTNGAGPQQRYHVYNSTRIYTRAQYSTGAWTAWSKEYNTGNKPTASDVGARPNTWMPTASEVGAIQKNVDTSTNGRLEVVKGVTIGASSLNDLQGDGTPWYGMAKTGGSSPWVKYSGYFGVELRSASQRVSVPADSLGFEFANNYGNLIIGPQNSSYCHFHTDREWFYMNKGLCIHGDAWCGPSYNYIIPHGDYYQITSFANASNSVKRYLHINTNTGAYGVDWWASDVKLKNNIVELTGKTDYISTIDKTKLNLKKQSSSLSALDTIKQIEHFSFNMLDSDSHTSCGYIANQLQEINDEFVMEVKQEPTVKWFDEETKETIQVPNPMYFEEDDIIKNPRPSAILPYITKAIQEQQEIIEKLMKRIEELEAK